MWKYELIHTDENFYYFNPETGESKVTKAITFRKVNGREELAAFHARTELQKPEVTIFEVNGEYPYGAKIRAQLKSLRVDGDLATAFCHKTIAKFTHKLSEELKLDGHEFLAAGDELNPAKLYEARIVQTGEFKYDTGAVGMTMDSDESIVFLLCYLHGMAQTAPNAKGYYLRELAEKAVDVLKAEPFYASSDDIKTTLLAARAVAADLGNHPSFTALVAALDMFFLLVPTHKYSRMRTATVHTFCKDYTSFKNLQHMTEISGMKREEWMKWAWIPEVQKELRQLTEISEFCEVKNSYFPYLRSFEILPRSPLAVSEGPALHTFIHAIGILRGNKRSAFARMVMKKSPEHIFRNARVFVEATSTPADVNPSSPSEEAAAAYQKHRESQEKLTQAAASVAGARPKDTDPQKWLEYARSFNSGEIPEAVIRAKSVLESQKEVRPGTILEAMKRDIEAVAHSLDPQRKRPFSSEEAAAVYQKHRKL
ncbi:uncharacterized protein LOC119389839 [Rhipicephalus sanguineus]|uniref:uncharacterized protein LOC119389839 n=1 Tax=Rhipicephalus sanguineus TaxID=34632 RepID=UPI001894D008|nr:uncharacterized protein LOC119389839 [Rhipicephalus sanguineus]